MDHSDRDFLFGIRLRETDQLIGLISLEQIDWPNGTAWMGVGIGEPEHRGKGYGSEAIRLLLKFAFHEINLHRVQLTVFAYNPAAITMYEKLGFVKEGIMRERLHRDGQRHDVLLYALLRPEWEAS
ncbi:MAG: GNAT family N-acetyltransferase [Chloroflexi bacterium]|nr:GNAT family N-acetyltransferase [Chloroflexota bacterium]